MSFFFISRASSPFLCFPDRYPTRKLIFHCPPSCCGPLTRPCLGPSVQGCAQDPTTPVCCTIFGLSFSALSSEISVVAGVYFLVLLFFPPPPHLFLSHIIFLPLSLCLYWPQPFLDAYVCFSSSFSCLHLSLSLPVLVGLLLLSKILSLKVGWELGRGTKCHSGPGGLGRTLE